MTERVDVVVVGSGVMGAATAWRLAKRGRKVALLERFQVGHSRGSSHGASRVFRYSYDDPMYVRMAMDADVLWREIGTDAGEEILTKLGGVDFGSGWEGNVEALRAEGADVELLDPEEAMRRFPLVSLPGDRQVLFQPDAGIARAERAVRAFVRCAVDRGAELREVCRVVAVEPYDRRVVVRTDDGDVEADVAVVTAGAYAEPLLREAGIDLPVTPSRETVAYFRMEREMELPILVEWGDPIVYALPDPGRGVKAGGHHTGHDTDPEVEEDPDPRIVEMLSEWVRQRYPSAEPAAWLAETCLYTNTSDERFILERHGNIVVGSACSGHGFKFAPLLGQRVASLALERR